MKVVQEVFPPVEDLSASFGFLCYKTKTVEYELIVTTRNEMGVSTAHSTINTICQEHKPRFIVCLGMCGSLDSDAKIGDVCFSQEIIDINENQKIEKGKTKYNPKTLNSNFGLDKRFGIFEVHPSTASKYIQWQADAVAHYQWVEQKEKLAEFGTVDPPTAQRGPIICGPVVADGDFKDLLKGLNRKVIAVETETAGIYQALGGQDKVEIIAIRGVADPADDTKKRIEAASNSAFRQIATRNAANFLRLNLESNPLVAQLLLPAQLSEETLFDKIDPVTACIASVESSIDVALTKLSPEYRATERGYVLPVPRVKLISSERHPKQYEPSEIVSSLTNVVLEFPTTYPDRGLPWLYAKSLVGQAIDGKILIPIVVDASQIAPPKETIRQKIDQLYPGVVDNEAFRAVVIISNPDFSTERKTQLLLDEASTLGLCTVIFASSQAATIIRSNARYSNWDGATLSDVSFSSIVSFLSANFHIVTKEAEVIAMRLSTTFRAYNLPAHPTYFAGIPREMLSRLSEANHRAELIDLAVTGFLSFLGAGDTMELTLKQRTRRLFLRDLAFQMIVEKKKFDTVELVQYVKEYAEYRDWVINELHFVNSFIDNGILMIEAGAVVFAIPFIQNYLLAEELAEQREVARRYFDPLKGEIDFPTFELYAEIGLSVDVLADITQRIDADIAEFPVVIGESDYTRFLAGVGDGKYKSSGHYFVKGLIKPSMFSNLKKSTEYQARLERAATKLVGSDSETTVKQEIIDLTNEARLEARAQIDEGKSDESIRTKLMQNWSMGAILLGAAAEQLDAMTKRKLAASIVRMAALIADDWLRLAASHDFEKIRKDMRGKVEVRAEEEGTVTDKEFDQEQRKYIADVITDLVEMTIVSSPMMTLFSVIAETAKSRVLYQSLSKIDAADAIEELFISIWKLELSDGDGLTAFRDTVKKLPKDAFVRMVIATYLVNRAYWYRPTEGGRGAFADAANETLKPLTGVTMKVDLVSEES